MAATSSMRMLVVDDDDNAAMTMAVLLKRFGHETQVAASGEVALQKAPQLKPDAVFIDLALPVLDGLSVAKRFRQMPAFAETPLIAVSDHVDAQQRTQAATAGFDELLSKPYCLNDLLEILTRVREKLARSYEQLAMIRRATAQSHKQSVDTHASLEELRQYRQRFGPDRVPLVLFLGWDETPRYNLLSATGERSQIVACDSFSTFLALSAAQSTNRRQCLVVDATADGIDAVTVVGRMAGNHARWPVVALVPAGDVRLTVRLMRAGAFDVVEKSAADLDLVDVIGCAIKEGMAHGSVKSPVANGSLKPGELADADRQLLELTLAGALNKQIARELDISVRTVHLRRAALMKKAGARNRSELIRIAVESGIGAGLSSLR
jgi:FixJ family two-component response regulator